MATPHDDDDQLDGCDLDFADFTVVSTDDDVTAIQCFGDLPWTGEVEGGRPVVDPEAVAERKAALEALAGA